MSRISDIRDAIKGILDGVSGIGKVYDQQRYASNQATFESIFKSTANKIDAWTMQLESAPEDEQASRTNYRTYNWVLRHKYGFEDNVSQKVFEDFNEEVCDALRAKPQLNGTATIVSPPQVRVSEIRQFYNLLVHYAELTLSAQNEIQY